MEAHSLDRTWNGWAQPLQNKALGPVEMLEFKSSEYIQLFATQRNRLRHGTT